MIVKDVQTLSIVENERFGAFVNQLDPPYTIHCRKALNAMMEKKNKANKEKAMSQMKDVSAVSLTADMWTSINMDEYLAVTCNFIVEEMKFFGG